MGAISWQDRLEPREGGAKVELWRGERMFAGLNCFLSGQAQALHAHTGADKVYVVLRGTGLFEVGTEQFTAGTGELVPAPAGIPHGVRNPGPAPLVVLTVIAPPPPTG